MKMEWERGCFHFFGFEDMVKIFVVVTGKVTG